jgi:nucleoside 2-deoxyribosyltransferase
MMTKIYLAGSCGSESRTMMQRIAQRLREADYEVYCPFELKIENAWDMPQEEWARRVFEKDIKAIDACDIFLMISPGRIGTAGTNWEQGYAYARGKSIEVIQYTKEQTSLMTYCGADHFYNIDMKNLPQMALAVVDGVLLFQNHCSNVCETILT